MTAHDVLVQQQLRISLAILIRSTSTILTMFSCPFAHGIHTLV